MKKMCRILQITVSAKFAKSVDFEHEGPIKWLILNALERGVTDRKKIERQ